MLSSCRSQQQKQNDNEHIKQVNDWHQQREQSLREPDSWLSLVGLYPLEDGTHTFGADSSNDLVFPPKAPDRIGTITKEGNNFTTRIADGITVLKDSTAIMQTELKADTQGEPTTLRHGSLLWHLIERRGTYYIRLKDTDHPNFSSFNGIDRFPVSQKWRIKARFIPFEKPETITIPDILGETYQDSLYGSLKFTVKGKQYRIAPLGHPQNDEEFFIIFGDNTNGTSTYSGGRYLYIPTPNENGVTYIDFNKAYNPPCVFTDFATCPLPPAQNRLDLNITAGEKMYQQ